MVKPILTFKEPILREVSIEVDKVDKMVKEVVQDLKDTLGHFELVSGVGLSAVQIGVPWRIFIIKQDEGDPTVVINPKITNIHKGMLSTNYEGCLSIPVAFGFVSRPTSTTMSFLTEKGEEIKRTFNAMSSVIALHEFDHLNGNWFVDRAFNRNGRRDFYRRNRVKLKTISDPYLYE